MPLRAVRYGSRGATLLTGPQDADDAAATGLDNLLEYAPGKRAVVSQAELLHGGVDGEIDEYGDDEDGTCCAAFAVFCRGVCCAAKARSRRCAALQLLLAAACIAAPGYAIFRLLMPGASGSGGGPAPPPPLCKSSIYAGALDVVVDGVRSSDWAVIAASPASIGRPDAGSLQVTYGNRAYLVYNATRTCPQSFSAGIYERSPGFYLLGRALKFTVDLSSAGCACCGSFYLSSMPGYGPDGAPMPGQDGDYTCVASDAKDPSGGAYARCPEVDIIEANNHALQICPHKCDAPNGHVYPACDGGGCDVGTIYFFFLSLYGPGPTFTIDTTRPFDVTTSFGVDGANRLSSVLTVLSQPGATADVSFDLTDLICGTSYLENVTAPLLAGMTPVFSMWGGTGERMQWLDVPPCDVNEACSGVGAAMVVSNISITTLPPDWVRRPTGRRRGGGAAVPRVHWHDARVPPQWGRDGWVGGDRLEGQLP